MFWGTAKTLTRTGTGPRTGGWEPVGNTTVTKYILYHEGASNATVSTSRSKTITIYLRGCEEKTKSSQSFR